MLVATLFSLWRLMLVGNGTTPNQTFEWRGPDYRRQVRTWQAEYPDSKESVGISSTFDLFQSPFHVYIAVVECVVLVAVLAM